jgi:hypothetical protein
MKLPRQLKEGTIASMAVGKSLELGRQLVLATDTKFAEGQAKKVGAKAETLQTWANGYIALDAVISVTGVLAMLQAIRKNRKGAGQAAYVQGITVMLYGIFYLFYSLFALGETKAKLINIVSSIAHFYGGIQIYRFAQKAIKPSN